MIKRYSPEKPFVSVVTPTWQRAAFLPYLLYMFRYQDYPAERRELIILDDSPTSSLPIVNALTHDQPERYNIHYIHHPERLKLGKKRNMLNTLAKGEYIVCMDDDDFYPVDKLSYTIEMMQRHGALISGSDQIPVWYSHIDRVFKTRSFGKQHILNGTFCYHRNYLKKHRYDDECQLGEEQAFTNNFSVRPLQLPGERTILCVSHSDNTFDKDFVLGSCEPTAIALSDIVRDPTLLAWYQRLHNSTGQQPIQWQYVEKVLVINLDRRADRWQQMQRTLGLLGVPEERVIRISGCEHENGTLGRTLSHLQALTLAQQQGWRNCLVLEDDALLLTQAKHISALNRLLAALDHLPWEVVLLGARVNHGQPLKSLPGLIHAVDCEKVCAYLVNASSYPALIQQMKSDPASLLESRWRSMQKQGKWLAFYPCICYQRPGFSDIERQETDHIRFYFNKMTASHTQERRRQAQQPVANQFANTIGFYLETAFHYQLYQPILHWLLEAGYRCDLLISDAVPKAQLKEMSQLLTDIKDPRLSGSRLSEAQNRKQRYGCLVSPNYTPALNGLGQVQIRAMSGLAKASWNHAWWNTFYHHILCYSHYSQQALNINGNATVVGNPRFDAWHRQQVDLASLATLKLDAKKPTLLYAPTSGDLSSIPAWAASLSRLGQEYNLIIKLHHSTQHRPEEAAMLAEARRHFKRCVTRHDMSLPLLHQADYVLTDNSGFIFDAIHAGKRTILLDWEGMKALLKNDRTFSTLSSPEQQIRTTLPVVRDMAQLRHCLAADYDWQRIQEEMFGVRHHYCDAFQDGFAGKRAAELIMRALDNPVDATANTLLHSLQSKLF